MATLSPELEASLAKISSDWVLYLSNIKPDKRQAELKRLLKRHGEIYQILLKRHQG